MKIRYMRGDPLEGLFPEGSTATSLLGLSVHPTKGFQVSDGYSAKKIMTAYVILERVLLAHTGEVAGLLPWSGSERLTLLIQPRGEYRVIGEVEAEATLRAANAKALL